MDNLNNIPNVGTWGDAASKLNDNFNKVKQAITTVENTSKNNKGYFSSLSALNTAFPNPKAGQTAYVYSEASSTKYYIYNAFNGGWVTASVEAPSIGVDIAGYTKTGGSTKTTQDIDDTKANHGYASLEVSKTVKEVEDEMIQLAGEKLDNFVFNISSDSQKLGILKESTSTSTYSWIPTLFPAEKSKLVGIRGYFDGAGTCILSIVKYGGNTGIPTMGNDVTYTIVSKFNFNVPVVGYNEIDLSDLNIVLDEKSSFFIEENSPVKICYSSASPTGALQFRSGDVEVGSFINATEYMYVSAVGLAADWILTPLTIATKAELEHELFEVQDTTYKPYVGVGTAGASTKQIVCNNTPVEIDGYLTELRYFISAANKEFYVCTLDRMENTDNFKIIDRVKITSTKMGENINKSLMLRVQKGQYIGYIQYAQSVDPNSRFPYYSGNNDFSEGWWQGKISEVGETATFNFVEKASLSAGFKIKSSVYVPRGESIKTTKVVVSRNSQNYNSIRETIASLNSDYYNRYIVFVPRGRWHECDITGRKYVQIVGEDKYETIIYVDGNSSEVVTPSDYSFANYANLPLSEIPSNRKHAIFVRDDLDLAGLTIEAQTAKYAIHIDYEADFNVSIANCIIKDINNLNYCIGIGIRGGQKININNCKIVRNGSGAGIFIHNWNNQQEDTLFEVENTIFDNCDYMVLGELGSERNDTMNIINCYSTVSGGGAIYIMVDQINGATYWTNPSTGEKETDPTKLPYSIKLNCVSSSIGAIRYLAFDGFTGNPRPNFIDRSITRIQSFSS